ncbi:MAG TPA: hypothetical protein VGF13_16205 [Verrucomicrobiae bacterium]|jgi:hypothetical protein
MKSITKNLKLHTDKTAEQARLREIIAELKTREAGLLDQCDPTDSKTLQEIGDVRLKIEVGTRKLAVGETCLAEYVRALRKDGDDALREVAELASEKSNQLKAAIRKHIEAILDTEAEECLVEDSIEALLRVNAIEKQIEECRSATRLTTFCDDVVRGAGALIEAHAKLENLIVPTSFTRAKKI